ncbi:MAG TPA: PH domain-containing protein [Nocardioidaceae bacterium]|nr:PH domain-containing protein [Nocardioidaceae bacterium]
MPADSETPSSAASGGMLLERFRPLGIRWAAIALGLSLLAVVIAIWVAFPAETREKFTFLQLLTLFGFAVATALAGYAMGRCRVDALEDGLLVVNGFRARHYPWAQISRITLRHGAPWAILELKDGTTASAMGIQGSDGTRAVTQVKRLRGIMSAQTSR